MTIGQLLFFLEQPNSRAKIELHSFIYQKYLAKNMSSKLFTSHEIRNNLSCFVQSVIENLHLFIVELFHGINSFQYFLCLFISKFLSPFSPKTSSTEIPGDFFPLMHILWPKETEHQHHLSWPTLPLTLPLLLALQDLRILSNT